MKAIGRMIRKRKGISVLLWALLAILLFTGQSCDKESDDGVLPQIPIDQASDQTRIISDVFQGEEVVVVGNQKKNFIVSFFRELEGELIEFLPTTKALPVIMEDADGNEWDVFGMAQSGPYKGKRLRPTRSLMGYWFSIAAFYPGTEIYPNPDKGPFAGETIEGTDGWTVPRDKVVSGGPGRDGIPSVDNPVFKAEVGSDQELVVGIRRGEEARAYPHFILDWHEIVNDQMNADYFSIVYCPLTGTATAWNRNFNGVVTTFGVSGLLYNSNIIPYDRQSNSNWSQLKYEAISGALIQQQPELLQLVETTAATWGEMYPDTETLSTQTGHSRSYGSYPYGDYKSSQSLIFNVGFKDKRLHLKERVHAIIINGQARVYRFDAFKEAL